MRSHASVSSVFSFFPSNEDGDGFSILDRYQVSKNLKKILFSSPSKGGMWTFILGFLVGILSILVIAYLILFNAFGKVVSRPPFIDQFQPLRIPQELKAFLRSHNEGKFSWESCLSVSLLLHFLFQEHKNTRRFRRWVYKKLQLELNDVTTRSAASRIIQGIQIRDLSLGTESPVLKNIRVECFQMSEDHELFDEIAFEVDIDYRGGFETSVDVSMIFNRSAHLSIKVMKLAGKARINLSRQPFAHWYFAFVEMPLLDFKIDSQFQGRQLKHVIPLITTAFRKAFQRKHVWPNYKIRYRPVLPHPLLQPTPPISSFDHINVNGTGLEVTVLQCTRLNTKLCAINHTEIFCIVSIDLRPFLNNSREDSTHFISVMLTFTRKGASDSIGLGFAKSMNNVTKAVKVSDIEPSSTAEKCGFKTGDILLAINNVPIRTEKQALRILSGTAGDLLVLVERDLNYYFEDEIEATPTHVDNFNDEEFIYIDGENEPPTERQLSNISISTKIPEKLENSISDDSLDKTVETNVVIKRDDLNLVDMSTSLPTKLFSEAELTQKCSSSKLEVTVKENNFLVDDNFNEDDIVNENHTIMHHKSANAPELSLHSPSIDILRSRSESDLLVETTSSIPKVLTPEISSNDNLSATSNAYPFNLSLTEMENEEDYEPPDSAKLYKELIDATVIEHNGDSKPIDDDDEVVCEDSLFHEEINDDLTPDKSGTSKIEKVAISSNKQAHSKRERIQARASEMASKIHASRAKFNDLIWSRNKTKDESLSPTSNFSERSTTPFCSNETECALDAGLFGLDGIGPTMDEIKNQKAETAHELPVIDKSKKKWIRRMRKSPTPSVGNLCDISSSKKSTTDLDPNDSASSSSLITSRSTKSVTLGTNPLWGQSLHFGLDQRTSKYLNIKVYSQKNFSSSSAHLSNTMDESYSVGDDKDAILLGYTSVYIPQIVEDCQLTLANCHREVFQLRPPSNDNSDIFAEFLELSRRTGFDARLCYGDITLGFRFFPQGLPENVIRTSCGSSTSNPNSTEKKQRAHTVDFVRHHEVVAEPTDSHPLQNSSSQLNYDSDGNDGMETSFIVDSITAQHPHKWTSIHFKHGFSYVCGICHGKIWLKWASRCTTCNFVCHNKCIQKANNQQECMPNSNFDDNSTFVVFEDKDFESLSSTTTGKEDSCLSQSSSTTTTTRRRRIANTVSEKLSSAVAAARRGRTATITTTTKTNDLGLSPPDSPLEHSSSDSPKIPTSKSLFLSGLDKLTNNKQQQQQQSLKNNNDQQKSAEKQKIVTVDKILDPNFIASLKGSNHLRDLDFEPGNAYNPQIINGAKTAGQSVFSDVVDIDNRKSLINEQIDNIQMEIDRLSKHRRRLISFSCSPPPISEPIEIKQQQQQSISTDDDELESLDVRREALALLMLYYCSGLSDCIDKEEGMNKKTDDKTDFYKDDDDLFDRSDSSLFNASLKNINLNEDDIDVVECIITESATTSVTSECTSPPQLEINPSKGFDNTS